MLKHDPVLVRFCIIILFMLNLRNYIWLIQKKFWLYSLIQKHWKIQKYKIRKIGIKKAISNSKSYSSKRKKVWLFI